MFSKDSGSMWMKASLISAPHENPTRIVIMSLSKDSFKPIKNIPMSDIKLTMTTDARIDIKIAIFIKQHSTWLALGYKFDPNPSS